MRADEILESVGRASLWRSDPEGWVSSDPDLQRVGLTGLDFEPTVLDEDTSVGVHLLTGPRRAGKTVTTLRRVRRFIESGDFPPGQVLRVSLDRFDADDLWELLSDEDLSNQLGADPTKPRLWVLDEITSVSGWEGTLRTAVEGRGPLGRDVVIATGSRAPELGERSLTIDGVRTWRRLLPMGFRDVAAASGIKLPDPVPADELLGAQDALTEMDQTIGQQLIGAFEAYIQSGGYPLMVAHGLGLIEDAALASQAERLPESVLLGAASDTGLEPAEAAAALAEIVRRTTSVTAIADFGYVVGGNRQNAEEILAALERSHVAWRLYRAKDSQRVEHTDVGRPKLYVGDPLLVRAAELDPSDHRDALYETVIGMHLGRSLCDASTPFWRELRYDRTDAGEVDFLPRPKGVPPVEVKAGRPGDGPAQLRALQGGGIVANSATYSLSGDVWCLPAAYLAALVALRC